MAHSSNNSKAKAAATTPTAPPTPNRRAAPVGWDLPPAIPLLVDVGWGISLAMLLLVDVGSPVGGVEELEVVTILHKMLALLPTSKHRVMVTSLYLQMIEASATAVTFLKAQVLDPVQKSPTLITLEL